MPTIKQHRPALVQGGVLLLGSGGSVVAAAPGSAPLSFFLAGHRRNPLRWYGDHKVGSVITQLEVTTVAVPSTYMLPTIPTNTVPVPVTTVN